MFLYDHFMHKNIQDRWRVMFEVRKPRKVSEVLHGNSRRTPINNMNINNINNEWVHDCDKETLLKITQAVSNTMKSYGDARCNDSDSEILEKLINNEILIRKVQNKDNIDYYMDPHDDCFYLDSDDDVIWRPKILLITIKDKNVRGE
jgi:hypothetical protein